MLLLKRMILLVRASNRNILSDKLGGNAALPYCYSAGSLYSANRGLTPADISYIVGCARDYNSDLLKDSTVVSDPRRVFRGGSPLTQTLLSGVSLIFVRRVCCLRSYRAR